MRRVTRSRMALMLVAPMVMMLRAGARGAPPTSWAKAGVSLADYAGDAGACAEATRDRAVTVRPETAQALDALSMVDLTMILRTYGGDSDASPLMAAANIGMHHDDANVARRTANFGAKYQAITRSDVRAQLQAALDQCLVDRGYVRIMLTPEQVGGLAKLKRGTAERTAYLHAIDSDPAVIAAQRVVEE
ncbi:MULTISPECIES: hypothetical protein [Sphingobium]|jgi:hypothetical protein|uniref:Uncharacterized protein n=1 Tax=Sphingobium yanoikuyae TaxID=13690 RepID=A0A0J9CYM8_SPHYA|nr:MULTISPECIES: hypothetical protein [Sphingobium]ATP18514.1 hypothetical protein BV87_08990 [Sphingobium yanoikuyae]KMW30147.1 hypothetical protein BV87_07200 [Sphingobium yanoikuyae]TKV40344.1 hypothetical protein A0U87_24580 [Sphingobium sp. MP9-4]